MVVSELELNLDIGARDWLVDNVEQFKSFRSKWSGPSLTNQKSDQELVKLRKLVTTEVGLVSLELTLLIIAK